MGACCEYELGAGSGSGGASGSCDNGEGGGTPQMLAIVMVGDPHGPCVMSLAPYMLTALSCHPSAAACIR
jgi:hypothetical protein